VTSNKYRFYSGDILYGKIRPYFKKAYRPNFPGICSTDILVFISTNRNLVRQDFLYHLIKTQDFTDKATETSTGTKMPRADWNSLKQIEYFFPPLPEQHAIASILSALDDKIENNLAMNKTLEAMAMALYKHWFVDFGPFQDGNFIDSELGPIPEGWEVSTIGEHFESLRGLSYKGKFLAKEGKGIPMHNLNSVFEGGYYKHAGLKWYSGEYKDRHIVKHGDLIATNTEQGFEYKLIGSPALIPECYGDFGIFSHHLYKMIPKDETHLSNLYLYYKLLDPHYRFYVTAYANGTTVNMMPKDGLVMPYLIIPSQKEVDAFTSLIGNYHQLTEKNLEENKALTNLRDTLLPKLINGEVRVKNIEKTISEVV
ncbi:MAG TPA: restriction endonuclease subunit S, partial [Pricia sp.]|nr:restriction endonuclease subunit S [Pricia sp.]